MSVRMMSAVWELDLPQNEKLILLALADHADDHGVCFPSVARIAWKSGYSVRQTQTIMAALRSQHIIDPLDGTSGGRGLSTRYEIHPEKGAKLASFDVERVQPAAPKGCSAPRKRVRPPAQKGEVATSPQSSLIIIEPSGNHQSAPAQAKPQPSPAAFTGSHLNVSEKQDHLLAAAFPRVDRPHEYRKADAWLEANPERRPKLAKFIHNWFSRISAPSNGAKGGNRAEERDRESLRIAATAGRRPNQ